MTEERPDIVIGPLTLVWKEYGQGRICLYEGMLARTRFTIQQMWNGGWMWHHNAGAVEVMETAPTLEEARKSIKHFLTALGIMGAK